jgi:hypothetical protein
MTRKRHRRTGGTPKPPSTEPVVAKPNSETLDSEDETDETDDGVLVKGPPSPVQAPSIRRKEALR